MLAGIGTGLMGIYENTISPIQDLYDRVIVSNLPKDYAPSQVKKMADDHKEKYHGINSQIEELISAQGIKGDRKEEEYKKLRKINEQAANSGKK